MEVIFFIYFLIFSPQIAMSTGWERAFKAVETQKVKIQVCTHCHLHTLHTTAPSPCGMSGVWLCCSLLASYLLPLTGAQKTHNHSALCQTDNPQHKPEKQVCARVFVSMRTCPCVQMCVLVHVYCVSGVVERIKGKRGSRGDLVEER